jgi:recombination protein RecT
METKQQELTEQTNQEIKPAETKKDEPKKEVAVYTPPALPKKLIDAGFAQILASPKKAFIASGGTEQQFAKEVNFAAQLLMGNDYLFECAYKYPDNFIEAIKNIALTGLTLNPELRLAYLVPYKGKVKFQSSYMGKVDILIRAGVAKWFEANLVYEKDTFTVVKGTESKIIHNPDYFADDRGKLMGGYWYAILPNGQSAFDVMPKKRIDEIQAMSEAVKSGKQSPWDTNLEEMQRKTVLNWGFKFIPKTEISPALLKVIETESQFDNEVFEDWKQEQQNKKDKFDEDGIEEATIVK